MVRQVLPSDYEAFLQIHKETNLSLENLKDPKYKFHIQKNGFLLPSTLTKEHFEKDLGKIHFVYEVNNRAVGFLRIDEEQEMDMSDEVSWLRPDLKDLYFSKPHADIGGLAVLPEFGKTGIATKLLIASIEKIKEKNIPYLFSFVVISPITNFPSMIWHEKNDFERVAVSNPHTLFDMKNYQSFLFGKKILE